MDYKEIKELMKEMNNSDLTKLKIAENNVLIEMEKQSNEVSVKTDKNNHVSISKEEVEPESNPQELQGDTDKPEREENQSKDTKDQYEEIDHDKDKQLEIVTAPIVGTFYSAPGPDKEDYVKIGSKVEAGDVLCIVEAMKIMNEIENEVSGEVIDILCENGDTVEYGQELFKIKTSQ
ncbi:acetyl-CoA carboxylase biotin carboxyl carrier protein [Natranaerobius thermophilus]|uniref:Biotin carboxyl carrier protein of acetyl-CoA carboxylase n=1 Tax=Natranaerobius thermophilus (strain ATCC BAA-1301 / DSM 18059 / JW/NM-WN-LF) TaxID=457570 RepID=B2A863_NATTJ|nr:acetyl-CoA carboxylase biotin carboxyl carrier protein [Natranaerobius thermophilus]ACB84429.1 acetyl-CoA carboxylase, biotin carboxyl carrier protein [Natranaerobius thermophilus JW/NM-WN-LF]